MVKKPMTPEDAQARLEALCARSEHCVYELQLKLRNWGIDNSSSQRIINSLKDGRFVDDRRFARAFVNDKYRFSGHGRIKIALALRAKRVDPAIITEALDAIDPDIYLERLESVLASKVSRLPDLDSYEGRTKLYRFGISRGYESDLVARVIRSRYLSR